MAARTSFTSSSKPARALAVAAALVLAANAWVGARLASVIPESSIDNLLELERRVEVAPNKDHVKLLVFGNSHAVAGLRPATLAAAFGLKPDEAFSLAMPGASPREMRILANRYLDRFPQARVAVCGVEEYFLSAQPDMRLRYMTRFSPEERWGYAATYPKLDDRLGLMVGLALPVFDFSVAIRDAATARPLTTAQRLVTDVKLPGSIQARLATMPYRWGYPPPWDAPAVRRKIDQDESATLMWNPANRAWHLVSGVAQLPSGINQLDALAKGLERRGMQVVLAEMPYQPPLVAALHHYERDYALYKASVRSYLKSSGRKLIPAPGKLTSQHYYDLDHLNPAGADRMASWLKRQLEPMNMGQGGRL